jgi:hypothetical protein
MSSTLPDWALNEMMDHLSAEHDYYADEARERGLVVRTLYGVAPHPEELAVVVEPSGQRQGPGEPMRVDPGCVRFRYVAHAEHELEKMEAQLAWMGYHDIAASSMRSAYARALMMASLEPVRHLKWWNPEPGEVVEPLETSFQRGGDNG